MKRIILAALSALFISSTANAYTVYRTAPMIYMQRDPLAGTTRMRVHNDTSYPIVGIRSSNAQYGMTYRWGSPLQFGMIPPHSVAVVDFGDHSDACVFFVEIRTANGLTHVFGNVNVCAHNDIMISGW